MSEGRRADHDFFPGAEPGQYPEMRCPGSSSVRLRCACEKNSRLGSAAPATLPPPRLPRAMLHGDQYTPFLTNVRRNRDDLPAAPVCLTPRPFKTTPPAP